MPNMSHCRFYNTLKDLEDCFEHMDEENLGRNEKEAREELIDLCKKIANHCQEF